MIVYVYRCKDVFSLHLCFFFFFSLTILSWLLLPELTSFSFCRNGRKKPQLNRWEQRVQKDFLAKAQRTAKANASGREGKGVCPIPCRLRPPDTSPSTRPCISATRGWDGTGYIRQLIQDNIFCSLPNNATGQQ